MNDSAQWVVDTNVTVSGILFKQSVPGQTLDHVLEFATILHSSDTLKEIREVLARTKFDKYLTRAERDNFLVRLLATSMIVEPTEVIQECRDPDDDKWLVVAVAGDADGIMTGDRDLLVLDPFRGIPILTPAQYLSIHAPSP